MKINKLSKNNIAKSIDIILGEKHYEKHYNDISEITEADANIIAKIHLVINKIAKEQGIAETGYRIINNCKEDGGQEVKHLHFHLIGGKKLGTKMC